MQRLFRLFCCVLIVGKVFFFYTKEILCWRKTHGHTRTEGASDVCEWNGDVFFIFLFFAELFAPFNISLLTVRLDTKKVSWCNRHSPLPKSKAHAGWKLMHLIVSFWRRNMIANLSFAGERQTNYIILVSFLVKKTHRCLFYLAVMTLLSSEFQLKKQSTWNLLRVRQRDVVTVIDISQSKWINGP